MGIKVKFTSHSRVHLNELSGKSWFYTRSIMKRVCKRAIARPWLKEKNRFDIYSAMIRYRKRVGVDTVICRPTRWAKVVYRFDRESGAYIIQTAYPCNLKCSRLLRKMLKR